MTPERLEELEGRAKHIAEPWRPEAADLAAVRADNRELIAAVRALQAYAPVDAKGEVKERH